MNKPKIDFIKFPSVKYLLMTIFYLLAFTTMHSFSQVNTEALRRDAGSEGWYNAIGFSIGYADGNSEFQNYEAMARSDIVLKSSRGFVHGHYELKEAEGSKVTNKAFLHLRYIYDVSKAFQLEAFTQREFNEFISLKDRFLGGAGIRLGGEFNLDSSNASAFEIHIGLGAMYEHEAYNLTDAEDENLLRSTNYLNMRLQLNTYAFLSNVLYYQVDTGDFDDYRIVNDASLEVSVLSWMSLNTTISYRYDSEPLPGIEKFDFEIKNGFLFRFNQKR